MVPRQGECNMTVSETPNAADLSPAAAWSQRVRRVGGFIQLAFAGFWLIRERPISTVLSAVRWRLRSVSWSWWSWPMASGSPQVRVGGRPVLKPSVSSDQ